MTHFLNLISREMNLTLLTSLILHITSFGRPETACLGHACPRTSFLLPLEYCKWAAHSTAAFQEDRHKSERTVTYRGAGRLCTRRTRHSLSPALRLPHTYDPDTRECCPGPANSPQPAVALDSWLPLGLLLSHHVMPGVRCRVDGISSAFEKTVIGPWFCHCV